MESEFKGPSSLNDSEDEWTAAMQRGYFSAEQVKHSELKSWPWLFDQLNKSSNHNLWTHWVTGPSFRQ